MNFVVRPSLTGVKWGTGLEPFGNGDKKKLLGVCPCFDSKSFFDNHSSHKYSIVLLSPNGEDRVPLSQVSLRETSGFHLSGAAI